MGVVETQLESRRVFVGFRGERKPAEWDQQALGGDGIGDDNADQRPPEAPAPYTKFE